MKDSLVVAIAHLEGFYVPGDRPNRNNNPGDIEFGQFAELHGATREEIMPHGGTPRFAYFPTLAQGWGCLTALLYTPAYRNLTVAQAIAKFAPPVENDTDGYVKSVCTRVGCSPTDLVYNVLNGGSKS